MGLSVNPLTGFITAAVSGADYSADSSDKMDQELLRCIRRLPTDFASPLMVRRLALGRYEIGGRRTSLLWRSALDRELLVYEEEIQDPDAQPVPLFQYLREHRELSRSRAQE